MLLPSNFTETIADTFYDKTVTKLTKTSTSQDGWVTETGTSNGTFKANVRFTNLGQVQSEMGLTDQIDIAVTCATTVVIQPGDLFSYNSVNYKASAVVPSDSHLTIAGSRWA